MSESVKKINSYQTLSFICVDALQQSTIFQSCQDAFLSSWVEPVIKAAVKDTHITVPPVSLKLATLRSQVLHSTNWTTVLLETLYRIDFAKTHAHCIYY